MAKSIGGSVGFSASNVPLDVMTVQYLLDCVPAALGGPESELSIDGVAGPLTIAAIRRFQTKQIGIADGRVDPLGTTLARLQEYDPFPAQPLQPLPGGPPPTAADGSAPAGGKGYKTTGNTQAPSGAGAGGAKVGTYDGVEMGGKQGGASGGAKAGTSGGAGASGKQVGGVGVLKSYGDPSGGGKYAGAGGSKSDSGPKIDVHGNASKRYAEMSAAKLAAAAGSKSVIGGKSYGDLSGGGKYAGAGGGKSGGASGGHVSLEAVARAAREKRARLKTTGSKG